MKNNIMFLLLGVSLYQRCSQRETLRLKADLAHELMSLTAPEPDLGSVQSTKAWRRAELRPLPSAG